MRTEEKNRGRNAYVYMNLIMYIMKSAFIWQCMFVQLCRCVSMHSLCAQPCDSMMHCVRAPYLCIHIYSTCMCVCARWGRRQGSRFHSQSGSISSGRPQSWPPRGKLPTVGTSRDDCPCWGDCTCALAHRPTLTSAHASTYKHVCTCVLADTYLINSTPSR